MKKKLIFWIGIPLGILLLGTIVRDYVIDSEFGVFDRYLGIGMNDYRVQCRRSDWAFQDPTYVQKIRLTKAGMQKVEDFLSSNTALDALPVQEPQVEEAYKPEIKKTEDEGARLVVNNTLHAVDFPDAYLEGTIVVQTELAKVGKYYQLRFMLVDQGFCAVVIDPERREMYREISHI